MYKFNKPVFIISLDFEMMWGVFDKRSIHNYGENILGVHSIIPKLLDLFREYEIHVTWAPVGCLYFEKLEELKNNIPKIQPRYVDDRYSTYSHMKLIDEIEFVKYYSGFQLLNEIKSTPNQEIATHTFCHYYCLEDGQTYEDFRVDLKHAIEISAKHNNEVSSIIFPRNQYDENYLRVIREEGLLAFRGNENNYLQRPRGQKSIKPFMRFFRLIDSYINLTGYNIYSKVAIDDNGLINLPASFFFRPFYNNLKVFEPFKLRRIKKAMLAAARTNSMFHLWWHPHNYGANSVENLCQLKDVLEYYKFLNQTYYMQSLNMKEITDEINAQR